MEQNLHQGQTLFPIEICHAFFRVIVAVIVVGLGLLTLFYGGWADTTYSKPFHLAQLLAFSPLLVFVLAEIAYQIYKRKHIYSYWLVWLIFALLFIPSFWLMGISG